MAAALIVAFVPAALAGPAVSPGVLRAKLADAPSGATSSARQLPVTSGQDGAPGSLRQLVEQVAKRGDSIVFPTALRVELRRNLTIPADLAGLTIDGSSAAGGMAELVGVRSPGGTFLEVDADRVVLRRLKLTSLPVVLRSRPGRSGEVGPAGLRVVDVETAGSTPGHSGLDLSFARDFLVSGGRITNGIDLTLTEGGRIANVTLAAKGKALEDLNSEGLVIGQNTLESGRVVLRSQSVQVNDNVVHAGGTIDVWIHAGGTGRVSANKLTGGRIVAQAGGSLTVSRNTVTGNWRSGPGLPGISIGCATDGRRPQLVASDNTVRGMRIGFLVQCNREVPISLRGNVVQENGTGIAVNAPVAAISGGSVRENRGTGIQVRAGSRTTIRNVVFGGNGGLAIDRADAAPRAPTLRYDKAKQQIRGVACPGCAVDLYVAEEGKEPGEGTRRLGTLRARGDGSFEYPARGGKCTIPEPVSAIATDERRKATSEFAADIRCQAATADLRVEARIDSAFLGSNGVGRVGGTVVVTSLGPAESTPFKLVVSSNRTDSARAAEFVFLDCMQTPTGITCPGLSVNRGIELAFAWGMPVSGAGLLTVRFEMQSDTVDPQPANNVAEVSVDLKPSP